MKYFNEWDELVNAANGKVKEILKNDVSPIAEDILKKHIQTDIYNVYTPKTNGWVSTVNGQRYRTTYTRRHVLEQSVTTIFQNDNTIIITSTATASSPVIRGHRFYNNMPGAFLKLLEVGNMGIWKNGFPRPAVKNTQTEIDTSVDISTAIQKGVEREIG